MKTVVIVNSPPIVATLNWRGVPAKSGAGDRRRRGAASWRAAATANLRTRTTDILAVGFFIHQPVCPGSPATTQAESLIDANPASQSRPEARTPAAPLSQGGGIWIREESRRAAAEQAAHRARKCRVRNKANKRVAMQAGGYRPTSESPSRPITLKIEVTTGLWNVAPGCDSALANRAGA